jgi:hypothetical protein
MADGPFPLRKELEEAGFACLSDEGIGGLLSQLASMQFGYFTPAGLDYYENHIVRHQVSPRVLSY